MAPEETSTILRAPLAELRHLPRDLAEGALVQLTALGQRAAAHLYDDATRAR